MSKLEKVPQTAGAIEIGVATMKQMHVIEFTCICETNQNGLFSDGLQTAMLAQCLQGWGGMKSFPDGKSSTVFII